MKSMIKYFSIIIVGVIIFMTFHISFRRHFGPIKEIDMLSHKDYCPIVDDEFYAFFVKSYEYNYSGLSSDVLRSVAVYIFPEIYGPDNFILSDIYIDRNHLVKEQDMLEAIESVFHRLMPKMIEFNWNNEMQIGR